MGQVIDQKNAAKKMKMQGQAALDVIEWHTEAREWFIVVSISIADGVHCACTQSAATLGFEVHENVQSWLSRVEK